jgi:hypothetical protein
MGIINFLDFIKYSSKTNENKETSRYNYVLPEKVKRRLTDDGKGNYVFHHYSSQRRDVIKPTSGVGSLIVSREEASALSSVEGVAQYYTDRTVEPGVGKILHTVLVPKDEVYYLQTDALNFYDEAKERFQKVRPGQAFSPNYQAAWISKIANENGFKILVSEWGLNKLRGQTTLPLIPEKENVEMKPEEKFEIGEKIIIYPESPFKKYAEITKIEGDILYCKPEDSTKLESFNMIFDRRSISKIY